MYGELDNENENENENGALRSLEYWFSSSPLRIVGACSPLTADAIGGSLYRCMYARWPGASNSSHHYSVYAIVRNSQQESTFSPALLLPACDTPFVTRERHHLHRAADSQPIAPHAAIDQPTLQHL